MTFFVLTSNSLLIFSKTAQVTLSFPPEIIRFQEIVDRKAFETLVKNFFAKAGGGEGIFFLGDEVVYAKNKENSAISNFDEEAKVFFEKIPFQKDFLAKKIVKLKKQTFFFAAHRDYFTTIIRIIRSYGWDVKYVVPLPLFQSALEGKQLSYALLHTVTKNKNILEAADFSNEFILQEEKDFSEEGENSIPEEEAVTRTSFSFPMQAQYVIAVVCLLFFGIALYFAYPILFPAPVKHITVLPTPVITRVPSPTIAPVSSASATLRKSQIKIDVLNGSGTAGQATVIKNSLASLGYVTIDTGNAAEATEVTLVTFTPTVSTSLQQEIVAELKKSLAAISTQQVATADVYDVIITTGSPAQ